MNSRKAAIASVAFCGSILAATPSYAACRAQVARAPQQLSSGAWGATPSATSLDFGTQGVQQIFLTVTNSGTLPLTGATYTLSGSSFKNGMTLSLVACVGGTWNLGTGACTGGVVQTVATTSGAATSNPATVAGLFPAAAGTSVRLMAQLSKAPARTTTGSVTVTVDRPEVRPATATNA